MLCVIFRGKPTFHKITTGPDSDLLTNGKKFGSCSTVAALVKQLGTKQKNWPVPLINPVLKPEPIAPLSPVIEAEEPSVALPGQALLEFQSSNNNGDTILDRSELGTAALENIGDGQVSVVAFMSAAAAEQKKRDAEETATAAKAAAAEAEAQQVLQEAERQKQQEERRMAKEAEVDRKAHAKLIAGLGKKVTSYYATPDAPVDPLSELDHAIVLSQEDFDAVVATVDHFADGT